MWPRAARNIYSRIVSREEKECHPAPGVDVCKKPAIANQSTTWIIVGVIAGVLVFSTIGVLLFLHRRKTKRDKREDIEDQFQMSDYGLDDVPGAVVRPPPKGAEQRLSMDDLPRPGGVRTGHMNPFVSPVDDDSMKGGPKWPTRQDSTESSQSNLPPNPPPPIKS